MGIFFKKDFLVYWRDRKEMLISLLMPLVLILILGFALPGWVENSSNTIDVKAALVVKDDYEYGMERFMESVQQLPLAAETKAELNAQAERMNPARMLTELLMSEEVKDFVHLSSLDEQAALTELKEGKIEAIITIPESFTQAALDRLLLNSGDSASVELTANKDSLKVSVLNNIITGFLNSVNEQASISYAIASQGGIANGEDTAAARPVGGMERIEGASMITSFQYYTLAVSLFFALMVAGTTASKAITEKREQVFMRILLAGTHPYRYLSGKIASTFIMSMLQLTLITVVSHFIFRLFPDKTFEFWAGLLLFGVMFCLTLSALSGLFTALLFRMNDADVASGISFILLVVMGVIGGNLVPLYILPDWLMGIGSAIPNGIALTSMLQWIQGIPFSELRQPILYQALFFAAILAASLWVFPRRERKS